MGGRSRLAPFLNRGLRPAEEDGESMSPKRARVAALTLVCALAIASRADATGAPEESAEPVRAMTLEQAADWLDAASAQTPPAAAQAMPSEPAREPSDAAVRAGNAGAAFYDVANARTAEWFARVEPYLPRFLVDGVEELQRGDLTSDAMLALATVGVLLVLLGAFARTVRGNGAIAVTIDYPAGLRGTFCVKLSRRATASTRTAKLATPSDAERARHAAGEATPSARYGVARETQFLRVPCLRH